MFKKMLKKLMKRVVHVKKRTKKQAKKVKKANKLKKIKVMAHLPTGSPREAGRQGKTAARPQKKKIEKANAPKVKASIAKKPQSSIKAEKQNEPIKASKKVHVVYLGLGSNVGDREEYIEQAVFLLSKTPGIKVTRRSTNYETEAEGVSDQPAFLNAAIEIKTKLSPYQLLELIQESENALGRERDVEWGPRTIDVDILFYDNEIISDDKLQVPHPLIHERLFALIPLAEISPKLMHPVLEKSIGELVEERKTEVSEKYDDELPGFKEIKKGVADDYERW